MKKKLFGIFGRERREHVPPPVNPEASSIQVRKARPDLNPEQKPPKKEQDEGLESFTRKAPRKTAPVPSTAGAQKSASAKPRNISISQNAPAVTGRSIIRKDVVLELGDFLRRIPPEFLKEEDPNPTRELIFSPEEVSRNIEQKKATIPLTRLFELCPDVFNASPDQMSGVEIYFPWQKLSKQLDILKSVENEAEEVEQPSHEQQASPADAPDAASKPFNAPDAEKAAATEQPLRLVREDSPARKSSIPQEQSEAAEAHGRDIAALTQEWESALVELEETRKRLDAVTSECETLKRDLAAARRQEGAASQGDLQELTQQRDKALSDLRQLRKEFESRIQTLQDDSEKELAKYRSRAGELAAQNEAAVSSLAAAREEARRKLEEHKAAIAGELSASKERADAAAKEAESLRKELQDLKKKPAANAAAPDTRAVEELKSELAEVATDRDRAIRELNDLRKAFQEQAGEVASTRKEIHQLRQELKKQQSVGDPEKIRAEAKANAERELQQIRARAAKLVEQRDEALALAAKQRQEHEARVAELQKKPVPEKKDHALQAEVERLQKELELERRRMKELAAAKQTAEKALASEHENLERLKKELTEKARSGDAASHEMLTAAVRARDEARAALQKLQLELDARQNARDEERTREEATRTRFEKELAAQRDQAAAGLKAEREKLQQEAASKIKPIQIELDRLRENLNQLKKELETARRERDEAKTARDSARRAASEGATKFAKEKDAALATLAEEKRALEKKAELFARQRQTAIGERDEVVAQLASAKSAAAEKLKGAESAAAVQIGELKKRVDELEQARSSAEQDAAAKIRDVQEKHAKLAETSARDLAGLRGELHKLTAERDAAKAGSARAADLQRELDALKKEREAARSELESLRKRLEQAETKGREESLRIKRDLDAASAQMAQLRKTLSEKEDALETGQREALKQRDAAREAAKRIERQRDEEVEKVRRERDAALKVKSDQEALVADLQRQMEASKKEAQHLRQRLSGAEEDHRAAMEKLRKEQAAEAAETASPREETNIEPTAHLAELVEEQPAEPVRNIGGIALPRIRPITVSPPPVRPMSRGAL